MADKTRRPSRLFIIIPLIIAALLLGGYTALWFYGAGVMRDEIAKFVANEEAEGRTVMYDRMSVRGFPIALRAQIEEFTWADPDEWVWSGETLHIIAMPYDPTRLIFAPRGPQAVITNGERYSVTPNDLRVGIAEDAYSAEGYEMLVTSENGQSLSIGSLKSNWHTDNPGSWILGASLREVVYDDTDTRRAILPGVNIAMSHEPGQGDDATIDASEIAFDDGSDGPPTLIKVTGNAGVDEAGYPAGRLNVTYRDERKLLALLERFEVASPAELRNAGQLLAAFRSGKTEATVPFAMQDGSLYITMIGRQKIGDLPKID